MSNIVLCLLFLLVIPSCRVHNLAKEDVFKVSEDYCDCLEKQLKEASDSTVNLNDCERLVFSKSRLLSIYGDYDNWDKYDEQTLDSSQKFAIELRNITDTLCYNKIDFKKVKRTRHM